MTAPCTIELDPTTGEHFLLTIPATSGRPGHTIRLPATAKALPGLIRLLADRQQAARPPKISQSGALTRAQMEELLKNLPPQHPNKSLEEAFAELSDEDLIINL